MWGRPASDSDSGGRDGLGHSQPRCEVGRTPPQSGMPCLPLQLPHHKASPAPPPPSYSLPSAPPPLRLPLAQLGLHKPSLCLGMFYAPVFQFSSQAALLQDSIPDLQDSLKCQQTGSHSSCSAWVRVTAVHSFLYDWSRVNVSLREAA